jgi:uncharacterized protein (TIGR00290 family)
VTRRALVSWSGGKDAAYALHVLRDDRDVEVVGLLSTVRASDGRMPIHEVPSELLEAQAAALGLPLTLLPLPAPCPNETYIAALRQALAAAAVDAIAFGDLFLTEIRAFREDLLAGTGVVPFFPLWGQETSALAREIVASGVRSVVVAVDTTQLDAGFAGRAFDDELLDELPDGVDACAENGELHTFVWDAPGFAQPIAVRRGDVISIDGFAVCPLEAAGQMVLR